MNTLQKVLAEDPNRHTKKELVDVLQGLREAIGAEAYASVSGIDPDTELASMRKAEVASVLETFRAHYDPQWEELLRDGSGAALRAALRATEMFDEEFDFELDQELVADVSDGDFAAELGSIPFATLIGGPMDAAVRAQANASVSTVEFIEAVGFEGTGTSRQLRMVDFSYEATEDDGQGGTTTRDVAIKVPFISMLNVPSLRIETLEIDLHVKLDSTYTKDVSSNLDIDSDLGFKFGPVKFDVSVAYQRSSATGVKIEKEYSMGVKVTATNDELPRGLETVLGLMAA